MKAKTYTDYYNILLEGCKEAFKSIELKEYLYTDEAMEDNKEYFISKDCIKQIGTNISHNLIVNYQIERDMKTDFLRFLERQQQVFEKKYLIPRNEFYEKCLKSLNIKLTELNRQEYRVLKNISDMGTPPDPLLFLEYMKWDIKSKSLQTNKTPEPQQDKNIKTDEVIKEFKDFFIPDVKIETINNIQTNYKDLIGKKMAFLIYLLETEFKIINYSLNGKNDSRKHFVKSLKSIDTKMQGINKHFEANSTNLSIHKFENDNDYKKIKDFLTKTI